jgi:hypothetical protein
VTGPGAVLCTLQQTAIPDIRGSSEAFQQGAVDGWHRVPAQAGSAVTWQAAFPVTRPRRWLLEVIQSLRPPAFAGDIITDRFCETAGHVLVRLRDECPEAVPGGFVDLRADLDTLSVWKVVDEARNINQTRVYSRPGRESTGNLFGIFTGHSSAQSCIVLQLEATDAPFNRL